MKTKTLRVLFRKNDLWLLQVLMTQHPDGKVTYVLSYQLPTPLTHRKTGAINMEQHILDVGTIASSPSTKLARAIVRKSKTFAALIKNRLDNEVYDRNFAYDFKVVVR